MLTTSHNLEVTGKAEPQIVPKERWYTPPATGPGKTSGV